MSFYFTSYTLLQTVICSYIMYPVLCHLCVSTTSALFIHISYCLTWVVTRISTLFTYYTILHRPELAAPGNGNLHMYTRTSQAIVTEIASIIAVCLPISLVVHSEKSKLG